MGVNVGRDRRLLVAATVATGLVLLAAAGCSKLSSSQDRSASSQGAANSTELSAIQPSPPDATSESGAASKESLSAGSATPSAANPYSAARQQLLVRTATMRLRVRAIDATLARIRATTAQFHGLIDDLQVSSDSDGPIYRPVDASNANGETVPLSAYVTVSVPSERLAEFSRRIAAFGKVLHESANQTDVTQQHIDLAARLRTARAEEVRLRQFLGAAKNVREMLLVETELSRVRSEIESMQSQLDYLDKQVSYGTLTVELQKPAPVVRPAGTDWGFTQAVTDGIRGAAATIRSFVTVVIALFPLIVLALIMGLAVRWALRRRHVTRTPSAASEGKTATPAYDETPSGSEGTSE